MADHEEDRRRPEIGVRVFGMDASNKPFSRTAYALQTSATGIRLRGVDASLRVGDVVGVQSGAAKARFRVTSIPTAAPQGSGFLDLASLDPGQHLWASSLSESPAKSPIEPPGGAVPCAQPASSGAPRERRHYQRYKCDIGALIAADEGKRLWARCSDICRGGCYLETWSPLESNKTFQLELDGIAITATVVACHPNVGMGVRFVSVVAPERLEALLQRLRAQS